MPKTDGIDVSHWNKPSGAPFTDLKFALCKATQGVSYRDKTLPDWWKRWRADKVPMIGAYHWIQGNHPPKAQFEHFKKYVNENGGIAKVGGFVMLDWEVTIIKGERITDPTVEQIEEWCALADAEWGADKVLVYSAPWVPGFKRWRERNPKRNFVLANYTSKAVAAAEALDACAVQWSSKGVVPGVAAPCDVNQILKPEVWERILGGVSATQPNPPVSGVSAPKPTLQRGSSGPEVVAWINALKKNGWYPKEFMNDRNDGKFGARTEAGTKKFQSVAGGTVDGIYGPKTHGRFSGGLRSGAYKIGR